MDIDKSNMPPEEVIQKKANNRKLNIRIYNTLIEYIEIDNNKSNLKNLNLKKIFLSQKLYMATETAFIEQSALFFLVQKNIIFFLEI